MRLYDVSCPICGTLNRGLYLEETDGWMECAHCKSVTSALKLVSAKKIPVYTMKQRIQATAAV